MRNPFQRRAVTSPVPGGAVIAARMVANTAGVVPAGCVGVAVDAAGHTRRINEGAKIAFGAGEYAWCFHPGPYAVTLTPFLAAPEMGLQLSVVVDRPDPLAQQQRFDLFLASEGEQALGVAQFQAALDTALQRELAQGHLDLPPCTQLDEWNAFRSNLNKLLYMRFGVTVDECIPVDLAGQVDYAAMLAGRAVAVDPVDIVMPPRADVAPIPPGVVDAAALRRLFLELPPVVSRLRQFDGASFARQRALLQRLDHAGLSVLTMPALALAAPGQPLPLGAQQIRARHAQLAVTALDEAWALLARVENRGDDLLDDAERITANLEHALAARRTTPMEAP